MTDIVERLNNELGWGIGPALLCQEAAQEIVKLRDNVSSIKTKILELRPHSQYLSDYHEGQLDLCDSLLNFINELKKNAN